MIPHCFSYPSSSEYETVIKALVKKLPCLADDDPTDPAVGTDIHVCVDNDFIFLELDQIIHAFLKKSLELHI